jgi:Ca2+-transporting ATPase
MVYRGTVVTGGSARALVVATGAATEVGQIQRMMTEAEQMQTPLQRQLHMLGEQMVMLSLAICGSVFVLGLLRGRTALQMLKTSVSLAVAAVPEGLPTVSTTTLALGLRRLEEQKVFVRQLGAVETLGALQAICLDKTGTITRNRMTLVAAFANTNLYRVEDGHFYHDGVEHPVHRSSELRELLRLTALCSEVELVEEAGEGQLRGTPTERALVQAAQETGIDVADVRRTHPLVRIRLRSEQRIFMDTLHKDADHGWLLAVKGSPTEVLDLCSQQLVHGELQPLTEAARNRIVTENERMAGRALRVLGVAYGHENTLPEQAQNLVWVGLVGIADPPRPGMAELVAELHEAGIHTTMITGDQSATAYAVAREIGLSRQGRMEILDSTRIEELEADVLRTLAQRVDVFARVSPAHKLQIVQALQHAGLVVAMTGDGVNDGPALRAANIGIAMGGDGSDVAQEVADIVVGDDNLATLIGAVEQGRTIYDDIKKAVHFILSSNTSEILVTLTATAAGLGEPLNPMQLLWINLVTDIFPELALSLEPPEEDIMQRPPRDPHAPMFSNRDLRRIGLEGGVITTTAMGAYLWGLGRYGTGPRASTMAFTSLTAAQLLHAISCRSEPHSIFDAQPFPKNPYIPLAVGGGLLLQVLATLTPGVRTLLGATRLGLLDWGVAATAAVTPLLTNEIIKVIEREENSTWHPNTSSPPKP